MKNTAQTRSVPKPSKARRLLRRVVYLVSIAYPVALVLLILALYFVGESWWVTTALLYSPRIAFAAPLPFLVVALLWCSMRRLLWLQLLAAFLVVVPLMGFVLPSFGGGGPRAASLRLLSLNANSGYSGASAIAAQIATLAPDVVLIQEGQFGGGDLGELLHKRYPYLQASTQFTIASRFPILEATDPQRLPYYGRERSPRFMRYLLDTPLGRLAVYSVHPISPRGALHVHRFRDVLHELRTGAFLDGDAEADVGGNAGLRSLQIATAAELASKEQVPVIIAGDTNLPGLSVILRKNLSRYSDAFRSASWGFGLTFPEKYPFLRLDRIFGDARLRFTSFQIGCRGISDHLCVAADIERQP